MKAVNRMLLRTLLISLSLFACASWAAIDVYEFSNQDNALVYKELTKELRCPKCQNNDIADSNAPIAKDMREQVHRLVEEGQSKEQVIDFMVERFGDFVTYTPKVNSATYLLWYGPWVLIVLGVVVVVMTAVRKRATLKSKDSNLSAEDRQRLDALLKESSDPSDDADASK